MRFYTRVHEKPTVASICMPGPWSVCIVNGDGESLLHRHMPTSPESFLKAMAPYRQDGGGGGGGGGGANRGRALSTC